MLTAEMKQKIIDILCRILPIEEKDIREMTTFEDMMADSLDQVEILLAIEREFSIRIPDDDFATVKTFGELCDVVEKYWEIFKGMLK